MTWDLEVNPRERPQELLPLPPGREGGHTHGNTCTLFVGRAGTCANTASVKPFSRSFGSQRWEDRPKNGAWGQDALRRQPLAQGPCFPHGWIRGHRLQGSRRSIK